MNMADHHLRFLVLPQRLQNSQPRKRYQTTRASENFIGNLKGFEDLPIDIALEVSIRFKYQIIVTLELLIIFLPRLPGISTLIISYKFPGSRSNSDPYSLLVLLVSSGALRFATCIANVPHTLTNFSWPVYFMMIVAWSFNTFLFSFNINSCIIPVPFFRLADEM